MYFMGGGARHDIIRHDIVATITGVRYETRGIRNRIGGGVLLI